MTATPTSRQRLAVEVADGEVIAVKAKIGVALTAVLLTACASTAPSADLASPPPASSQASPPTSTSPAAQKASHHHHHHHGQHAPSAAQLGADPRCDATLWRHIYHPSRLHVIDACRTVTGTVTAVRQEADGDLHILLRPVRAERHLLDAANNSQENGDLVLEPICVGAVEQADAVDACSGFSHPVATVSPGERIIVTGSYVLDADHGWMEIHPITSITILGGPAPAPAPPPSSAAPPPPPPPAPGGCHPKTPSGNCYEPGEFCSSAEHGQSGIAGDGKSITCENTDPGSTWHWV
jgi:hypothetical protein